MKICPQCALRFPVQLARCPLDGSALLSDAEEGGTSAGAPSGSSAQPAALFLERYRFTESLYGDDFAHSLYAEHDLLNKSYLVQLYSLSPFTAKIGRELFDNLVASVRRISELRHQCLPRIIDLGYLPEAIYLISEAPLGELLSSTISWAGALPREDALNLAEDLCAVIAESHRAGVIHGAISSQKLIISESADALHLTLLDLPLAAAFAPLIGKEQLPREVLRQVFGDRTAFPGADADAAASPTVGQDVMGLGVVLYEMLSGRRALSSLEEFSAAGAHQVLEGTGIDRALADVIKRAVDADPTKRQQSAAEFFVELKVAATSFDVEVEEAAGVESPAAVFSPAELSSAAEAGPTARVCPPEIPAEDEQAALPAAAPEIAADSAEAIYTTPAEQADEAGEDSRDWPEVLVETIEACHLVEDAIAEIADYVHEQAGADPLLIGGDANYLADGLSQAGPSTDSLLEELLSRGMTDVELSDEEEQEEEEDLEEQYESEDEREPEVGDEPEEQLERDEPAAAQSAAVDADSDDAAKEELTAAVVEQPFEADRQPVGEQAPESEMPEVDAGEVEALSVETLAPDAFETEEGRVFEEVDSELIAEPETARLAQRVRERSVPGQQSLSEALTLLQLTDEVKLTDVLLKHSPLSPFEVLEILRAIALQLAESHGAGILHRDIKPDNLLLSVSSEGELLVRLTNYISAGRQDSTEQGGAQVPKIVGTPQFMSPEQIRAYPLDATTDIYSLGVVMYAALTGRMPFVASSLTDLFVKHLTEEPAPAFDDESALSPETCDALEHLLHKALAKESKDRFQSVMELLEAFEEAVFPPIDEDFVDAEVLDEHDEQPVGDYAAAQPFFSQGVFSNGVFRHEAYSKHRALVAGGVFVLLPLMLMVGYHNPANWKLLSSAPLEIHVAYPQFPVAQEVGSLALADIEMRNLERAERRLVEGLRKFPESDGIKVAFGSLELARGNEEQAFAAFLAAVRINPGNQTARDHLQEITRRRAQAIKARNAKRAHDSVARLKEGKADADRIFRKLKALGPAAVPALMKVMEEAERPLRIRAMVTLGEIGAKEAAGRLLLALDDPDASVRKAAELAIGRMELESFLDAIRNPQQLTE